MMIPGENAIKSLDEFFMKTTPISEGEMCRHGIPLSLIPSEGIPEWQFQFLKLYDVVQKNKTVLGLGLGEKAKAKMLRSAKLERKRISENFTSGSIDGLVNSTIELYHLEKSVESFDSREVLKDEIELLKFTLAPVELIAGPERQLNSNQKRLKESILKFFAPKRVVQSNRVEVDALPGVSFVEIIGRQRKAHESFEKLFSLGQSLSKNQKNKKYTKLGDLYLDGAGIPSIRLDRESGRSVLSSKWVSTFAGQLKLKIKTLEGQYNAKARGKSNT